MARKINQARIQEVRLADLKVGDRAFVCGASMWEVTAVEDNTQCVYVTFRHDGQTTEKRYFRDSDATCMVIIPG